MGQCTMGLVVMVIVRTGLQYACGCWGGGRGLTTLRSFFDFWDLGVHLNGPLCLGFHLNVPLSSWTGKGVGGVGGVLEAPTLGSIGFRFSRVPPPTFSAAHTDLEYLQNRVRDGGSPSRCIYVDTWGTDFGEP